METKQQTLLIAMSLFVTLVIGIQPAAGTISIPSGASNIGTWDSTSRIFTLTTDVAEGLQIEQDNLTFDGAGHTVSGTSAGFGISLSNTTGVTVTDVTVEGFQVGIQFPNSNYNIVTNNTIRYNTYGLDLTYANWNEIYNNNFIDNVQPAAITKYSGFDNIFYLPLPIGGNYWSNWTGPDADGDGFVDDPYAFAFLWDILPWTQPDGWLVKTPQELLLDLVNDVIDLNLQQGINNSLDAKLDAVMNALDDMSANNDVAAINALEAFISAVEAQRGISIPEADADHLIAAALNIISLLAGT